MMSAPILIVECEEPEGTFKREIQLTSLTLDKLGFLWDKLKGFDVLFNDYVRGDFTAFAEHFILNVNGEIHPAGLMWDVDDIGLFYLNEIKPCVSASAHFVFWDKRLRGREHLCREMLKYLFNEYHFQRIEVKVPVYAEFTMNMVERIGMIKEGRLRNYALYKDRWFDVNVYSVIPLDLMGERKDKHFGSKARQICVNCGEVYRKDLNKREEEISHVNGA